MTEDYLTVLEVAALLRVNKQTVYQMVWGGHLPRIDIGLGRKRPRYRIRRSAVDEFMLRREEDRKSSSPATTRNQAARTRHRR
ncbi:helix-turn-helix domain-containing protein [Micromonospora sp. NPDC050417]|uniref:helix-turn-helix domain-containing protein n=1 Tax=Micromonospora sp. NPDC050417 TaxID=3364280 RepID=UPI00378C5F6F